MASILALDLSKTRTGWAVWSTGWERPRFGSWPLGSEYTINNGDVYLKLHAKLDDLRAVMRFDGIYYEEPISPESLSGSTNIKTVTLAIGLAEATKIYGRARRCSTHAVNVSNWRMDFVGADLVRDAKAAARAKRKATGKGTATDSLKRLAMERCRQLGFAPKYHDESDAIGILDFALDFHEHIRPPWRAQEVLRPPVSAVG